MARRLLIVEDNDGVAHLLAELATELGLEPARARGGDDAIGLMAPLPAAMVCDVVLEQSDGFQVARALRAQPGGEAVPLVVVSGVYRPLPPAFVEEVHPIFFAKPFDPQQLSGALTQALAKVDAATGLRRGRFVGRSPASLLVELATERATGTLEVALGEVRRRLFFDQGQVRFAQSNVKAESAGGLALAAGLLDEAAFEAAVQRAKEGRGPLHEALPLAKEALSKVLHLQTAEVAKGALAMLGAEWSFQAGPVDRQPEARRHPVAIVVEAAKGESADDARAALSRRGAARVAKSALLDRELFLVRSAWPGEGVTALAASNPTCAELAQTARGPELPLAWALVDSGLLTTEAPSARPADAKAAEPDDPDRGRRFNDEEKKAREAIFAERDRLAGRDHYQLFGVGPKAPVEEIRQAYLELARRYHSDRYSGLDLGSAQKALAELFQRVNEAMATLSDAHRRAEYDIYLERRAAGLPTDVGAILEAERIFQKGAALLKGGKAAEALEQFREAVRLNHAEAEFHAFLGYALFRVEGPRAADEARRHLATALELSDKLASGWRLAGLIALEMGEPGEAERAFGKALEIDPKDEEAARELRLLRRRQEKGAGGKGLFGRLFKKAK